MRLQWDRDGRDWPNRAASRFLQAGGLRWHVQRLGSGPTVLLLHGTGASTHSWARFAPRLAGRFDVIAPDLPGHGFTDPLARPSLPGFARAVADLLAALAVRPVAIVGHSAGAAVMLRMVLDGLEQPLRLVGLNAALRPFEGWQGLMLAPLARCFAASPWVPALIARRAADPAAVRRLVEATGSRIDPASVACYARLSGNPAHVGAVLDMMAGWDLAALVHDLPRLDVPLTLLVADNDRAVPPAQADWVARRATGVTIERLPRLGHLAHEEDPVGVADRVIARLEAVAEMT